MGEGLGGFMGFLMSLAFRGFWIPYARVIELWLGPKNVCFVAEGDEGDQVFLGR